MQPSAAASPEPQMIMKETLLSLDSNQQVQYTSPMKTQQQQFAVAEEEEEQFISEGQQSQIAFGGNKLKQH